MSIKVIIGVILIIVSFIYLIKNPGQSMLDGLMKKSKDDFEKAKAKAEAEALEAQALETEVRNAAEADSAVEASDDSEEA